MQPKEKKDVENKSYSNNVMIITVVLLVVAITSNT